MYGTIKFRDKKIKAPIKTVCIREFTAYALRSFFQSLYADNCCELVLYRLIRAFHRAGRLFSSLLYTHVEALMRNGVVNIVKVDAATAMGYRNSLVTLS